MNLNLIQSSVDRKLRFSPPNCYCTFASQLYVAKNKTDCYLFGLNAKEKTTTRSYKFREFQQQHFNWTSHAIFCTLISINRNRFFSLRINQLKVRRFSSFQQMWAAFKCHYLSKICRDTESVWLKHFLKIGKSHNDYIGGLTNEPFPQQRQQDSIVINFFLQLMFFKINLLRVGQRQWNEHFISNFCCQKCLSPALQIRAKFYDFQNRNKLRYRNVD